MFAHRVHSDMPLIVAGNRDEFHARPTQEAHWWPESPGRRATLGGRDRQAGGTWLAIGRDGRFATVTNYRDAVPPSGKFRSRGELVTTFLNSDASPMDYVSGIDGDQYAGFNLLVAADSAAAYVSNRDAGPVELEPGIYGVANATLDTPWSKVERSKAQLASLIDANKVNETRLLEMLGNREKASVAEVVTDQLPFERAHAMTAPFIVQPDYGTRSSTIVLADARQNFRFTEVRFRPDGASDGRSDFRFAAR